MRSLVLATAFACAVAIAPPAAADTTVVSDLLARCGSPCDELAELVADDHRHDAEFPDLPGRAA